MRDILYFDTAATTPVKTEVIQKITNTMTNIYGNPSSIHDVGQLAKEELNNSRRIISSFINAKQSEIIFTSGACEANTLAINGYINKNNVGIFVTSPLEHKSIELLANALSNSKKVRYVSVDSCGKIDLDSLELICSAISKKYSGEKYLVSIQLANSEIGTVQDIKKISGIVHKHNGTLHVDATQFIPHFPVDVKKMGIDMMSMSGQKIGAPKGIGFLYVKPGISISPIIYGSQMEYRRGGTENLPYISGLATAIQLLDYKNSIKEKREYLVSKIKDNFNEMEFLLNSPEDGLPNNINVSFKDINGESLLILLNLDGICVSTASACASGSNKPSNVLKAIGVPDNFINGTIRVTLPDDVTYEEIDYFVSKLKLYVKQLKISLGKE